MVWHSSHRIIIMTRFASYAGKIRSATSDPSDPATGEIYYNSTSNKWKRYNGSAWYEIAFTVETTTSTSTSTTTTTTSTSTTTTTTSTTTTTTSTSTTTTTTSTTTTTTSTTTTTTSTSTSTTTTI